MFIEDAHQRCLAIFQRMYIFVSALRCRQSILAFKIKTSITAETMGALLHETKDKTGYGIIQYLSRGRDGHERNKSHGHCTWLSPALPHRTEKKQFWCRKPCPALLPYFVEFVVHVVRMDVMREKKKKKTEASKEREAKNHSRKKREFNQMCNSVILILNQ